MSLSRLLLLLLPLLTALPVMAQPAALVRDSDLKSTPFADGAKVALLRSQQKIEVGERKGGWYKATTADGNSGWVRLTAVRLGTGQTKGESGIASTAQFLQSGRSSSSGVTAATGIRGLDAADVVNAKPDSQAVARLDGVTLSNEETRRFAADGKLTAKKLGYLPAAGK